MIHHAFFRDDRSLLIGLGVLLLLSLPGLYVYTEMPHPPSSEGSLRPPPLTPYTVARSHPVPALSGDETVPPTPFRLRALNRREKKSLRGRLRVDLNRATVEHLQTLKGIGPVIARRIVEARQQNGPFSSLRDLNRIPGMGPRTLKRLRSKIRLGSRLPADRSATESPPGRININQASFQQLQEINGIGPVIADRIVRLRHAKGPFQRPRDLLRVDGIGPRTLREIQSRIRLGSGDPSFARTQGR